MLSTQEDGAPELTQIQESRSENPHQFLGLHPFKDKETSVIRVWRPGAASQKIEVLGNIYEMEKTSHNGLFEHVLSEPIERSQYRIFHPSGLLAHDPYAIAPTVKEEDFQKFKQGIHYDLYRILGATVHKDGVQFAVWAPNAKSVYLKGDFNHWSGNHNPMRRVGEIWELFIPGIGEGEKYKFEIHTQEGFVREKSDPMAFFSELRPKDASICFEIDNYEWGDEEWERRGLNQPINIYEVHLGSWKKYEGEFPNYREIAIDLANYCNEMGFSHVELLPVMEHPLDESWGYQVTGFFSTTSRYGTPRDFQFFVDHMHQSGIGVILDWVPGHFPQDEFSLNRFDGTHLYEYADPRRGVHPEWHTAIFNYGKKEVRNFLIASALFWHDKMHIDGIRVDAVASILYLDYARKRGEWIPNRDGGNINYDAVEFLKHLNSIVHKKYPGTLMFAEESSTFQGVTHRHGLGFDLKWNMGWMNDTLHYFSKDPIYRKFHQNELTFSIHYAFSEYFACVLSHDEVVHEKKSILSKMPGPDEEKFANVRLLYSYMLCHPGKNLIFMGAEIGQWSEWAIKGILDWELLKFPLHKGLHDLFKDFNFFYQKSEALWKEDYTSDGFEWIDCSDAEKSVISYYRRSQKQTLICVHNFTPVPRKDYWIPLKEQVHVEEVFNTDAAKYGGSNQLNREIETNPEGMLIHLSGLSTMIFEVK